MIVLGHSDPARRVTVGEILRKKWLTHHRDLAPRSGGRCPKALTFGDARKLEKENEAKEEESDDDGSSGVRSPVTSKTSLNSRSSLENVAAELGQSFVYKKVTKQKRK